MLQSLGSSLFKDFLFISRQTKSLNLPNIICIIYPQHCINTVYFQLISKWRSINLLEWFSFWRLWRCAWLHWRTATTTTNTTSTATRTSWSLDQSPKCCSKEGVGEEGTTMGDSIPYSFPIQCTTDETWKIKYITVSIPYASQTSHYETSSMERKITIR